MTERKIITVHTVRGSARGRDLDELFASIDDERNLAYSEALDKTRVPGATDGARISPLAWIGEGRKRHSQTSGVQVTNRFSEPSS